MKDFKYILRESRYAVRRQKFYFCAIILFLAGGVSFYKRVCFPAEMDGIQIHASFGAVFLYCFRGIPFLSIEDYRVPALWTLLLLGCNFCVAGYAERKDGIRQQFFIRSRKRLVWWMAKCVWCIEVTTLYFLLGSMSLLAVCLTKGWQLNLKITPQLLPYLFDDIENGTRISVVKLMFLIYFGCIAWNLCWMGVAMLCNTYFAMVISVGMQILAGVVFSPWMPGNYLMLNRNCAVVPNGWKTEKGYLLFAALAALGIACGAWKSKKMDYWIKEG